MSQLYKVLQFANKNYDVIISKRAYSNNKLLQFSRSHQFQLIAMITTISTGRILVRLNYDPLPEAEVNKQRMELQAIYHTGFTISYFLPKTNN